MIVVLIKGWFHVQENKINAATVLSLLQGYCSTHLFYFILFYFIAHETSPLGRRL